MANAAESANGRAGAAGPPRSAGPAPCGRTGATQPAANGAAAGRLPRLRPDDDCARLARQRGRRRASRSRSISGFVSMAEPLSASGMANVGGGSISIDVPCETGANLLMCSSSCRPRDRQRQETHWLACRRRAGGARLQPRRPLSHLRGRCTRGGGGVSTAWPGCVDSASRSHE